LESIQSIQNYFKLLRALINLLRLVI